MWNPGASGANSSSSAQSQRQHVVPGDGDHHILQRGKTNGGAGHGASAIAPIPLVASPELHWTNEISHTSKRPCTSELKFYITVLNETQNLAFVCIICYWILFGETQAFSPD